MVAEVPDWVVEKTRAFVDRSGRGDEPAVYYCASGNDGITHHVVVVTGDFTIQAARLPRGARPPRGPKAVLDWSSNGSSVSLPRVAGDDAAFLGEGTPFLYKPAVSGRSDADTARPG